MQHQAAVIDQVLAGLNCTVAWHLFIIYIAAGGLELGQLSHGRALTLKMEHGALSAMKEGKS